ncbi:mechanosensitive ion channel family protein [Synechococcus sp. PCC 7336]|uniref:mechanosensitive ion channel family protein n=1 Tax=Synechococcus sp. PCC 7336 TaxID=195250 RepID=UPI00034B5FEF|nr:mechanosensitive ion channel domain-containing protein [Synechococcus sp. PCC 7336]
MQDLFAQLLPKLADLGIRLAIAVAILAIGLWLSKVVRGFVLQLFDRRNVDRTVASFVSNLVYYTAVVFVAIAALNRLGVQTASIIAVVGAAGLAIGLALQGSLSNLAAGFMMVILRPFKVGDFIEVSGVLGVVEEIGILVTKLASPDNKSIIIPNSKVFGDTISNFSAKSIRRIDLTIGVSYSDDLDKVKSVIQEVLRGDDRILQDPPPRIGVSELADSSVNFAVWSWVMSADYLDVKFALNERMKKRFDTDGISLPFPQRAVHLYSQN